jgi:ribosomal protein S17E
VKRLARELLEKHRDKFVDRDKEYEDMLFKMVIERKKLGLPREKWPKGSRWRSVITDFDLCKVTVGMLMKDLPKRLQNQVAGYIVRLKRIEQQKQGEK